MTEVVKENSVQANASAVSNRGKQLLWFGLFIATVLIGAVCAVAFHSTNNAKQAVIMRVSEAQKGLAANRAFAADNWIKSRIERARNFSDADIVQLFASEMAKQPRSSVPLLFNDASKAGDAEASAAVALQGDDGADLPSSRLPLMETYLTDFIKEANFTHAQIVNTEAELYLNTNVSLPPLTVAQRELVTKAVQNAQAQFGPITKGRNGLVMEIFLPILAPAYERANRPPVAVMILGQLVDAPLANLLNQDMDTQKGRNLRLVQNTPDGLQEVVPASVEVKPLTNISGLSDSNLTFDLRPGVADSKPVYSLGQKLKRLNWWLVVENDAKILQDEFAATAKTNYTLAGLASLAVLLLISAVWWWLVGRQQATISNQFKELLVVIEDQKKLLDSINNNISDPISLTDTNGVYRYVNKAFALAVGRKDDEVVGLDVPAVFGFDTARRLNASDQHVLMTGESISVQEVLWLQSKRFDFQVSKAPLRDAVTRAPKGIVSVFRDITELVQTQEKSRRVVQQTINALVRTIEEADPFLGGHSRIMGDVARLVSKQLCLTDVDVATIEAAANLSQIGKMFVPRSILLKPGALTPEEKIEMEQHVEHSRTVLKDIEFDLPVVEAIYQLNEHLDGSGYPRKLSGAEVSIHARVLAVANAFSAMARPRAYRHAIPVADVIAILEKQTGAYDQTVVEALREVLTTPAGEKLVAQAASAKVL